MGRITRITDTDDPRVAPYVAIRERDLTGRGERFIVEGRVTLNVLASRSRFEIESLFLSENRLGPLAGLIDELPEDIPVYTAPQALFDTIAGFHVHRGCLACARKGAGLALNACLGTRPVLVAVGVSNHDNMGALFRNAAAFGAGGVLIDATSCDPLYRKAIRVSAGTALWLPFARMQKGGDILEALEQAGYETWALTPREAAPSLWDISLPDRLALMVGPEGPGLPDHLVAAARPVRIPMHEGVDSVNVATAAAITLARAFAR
ncbi:MAG: RNA methyltransferase [Alphaproteobacteria bacterium]|jgi:tRNA G18 (ribose-2'-O)-methylase SpoU|nr:RNA methyltransferase [Alphaproteobacteria bacterium]